MSILSVKNLEKKFGDLTVLKNISFNINDGEIISIIGSSGSGKSTLLRCMNQLESINEIIEQNFSNSELSVDFLAEELCISRSGLFAKIKTLANVTPNELIQIVRLKKAAALLSENKYRINEICYMVGFNNPSYFAKCFQKQFGIKPGEFVNGKE